MLSTTKVNATTQKGQSIIRDLNYNRACDDIFKAYDRPSSRKVSSFLRIWDRAHETEGYNHDLHIVGAGSHFYSTIYSVSNADGTTSIIKDTRDNVYEVII